MCALPSVCRLLAQTIYCERFRKRFRDAFWFFPRGLPSKKPDSDQNGQNLFPYYVGT